MRLGELNWMDVESYLKKDDRIMVVLGSTEQHGYLSLMTDVKVPLALADAASQQSEVLVAPPFNYGCSPYFLAYPGTISVRMETLNAVVYDVVSSLYSQGFKRILFLNGHGGNNGAKTYLQEKIGEFPDLRTVWYSWWVSPAVIAVGDAHGLKSFHANWSEAFPFVRPSEVPQKEKEPQETNRILTAGQAREFYEDGVFGGLYQADDSIMSEVFTAALKEILRILDSL